MGSILLGVLTTLLMILVVIAVFDWGYGYDNIISKKTEKKEKKKSENKKTYESKYDSYKSQYHRDTEKEDNHRKLEKILNLVIKDFNNSPYNDKYICKTIGNNVYFQYNFNNGYKLTISDEYLVLVKSNGEKLNSFILDTLQVIQIYQLINKIIDNSVNRNQRTYSKSDYDRAKRKYDEYRDFTEPKPEPKVEKSGNPKLDKILEKIKLREEQLSKMRSNDPERSSLQNELNTYKNIANKMKSKI